MGAIRKFVVPLLLIALDVVSCKPNPGAVSDFQPSSYSSVSSHQLPSPPPAPFQPSQVQGSARKVLSSWQSSGHWEGSARLPSSSQSGGNEHSSTKDMTRTHSDVDRDNRRLHKWDKDDSLQPDLTDSEQDEGDGANLAQSLSSMATHLLDKSDDSLENSSERDVFLKDKEQESVPKDETEETSADEETDGDSSSPTNDPKTTSISTWYNEDPSTNEEDDILQKQKSDGPTTPKGLTTWSAVNGGGNGYVKGQVQKLPSDYTVSGALIFNTDRPTTTLDLLNKDRDRTYQTTEIPRTTKANNVLTTPSVKRRKPYHKNKKIVAPSKFVKAPLEEVTAEAIGSDKTHTIYKTRVTEPASLKVHPADQYTTKRPQWPYQLPVKRVVTTRRPPMAFSKITSKPKNPYSSVKRPQLPQLTLTTPTTTTPQSTTVYHRQPAPLMYPFPSISFTNLGFMDFLRSQIIPRIGLSLISFMAASPLILSMIGANALGRRKRSLDGIDTVAGFSSRAKFESVVSPKDEKLKQLPKFDFSTIKKKLHKLEMIQYKGKVEGQEGKGIVTQLAEIFQKLRNTKAYHMIKSKFFDNSGMESKIGQSKWQYYSYPQKYPYQNSGNTKIRRKIIHNYK